MALYYQRTCAMQYLYRLIVNGPNTTANISSTSLTYNVPWSFTIYGGSQPSANDLATNWASQSYYNTFLVHWQGSGQTFRQPGLTVYNTGRYMELNTPPSAATSYNSITTTATWGVMWGTGLSQATLLAATSTIPFVNYIVVPVSDLSGNGVIRLYSTSIAPTTSYSLQDCSMNIDIGNYF